MPHPNSQAYIDQEYKRLGQEIVLMMGELRANMGSDTNGYARRRFTFPGGEMHLMLCSNSTVADVMDQAAAARFDIQHTTIKPQ
jgi:hypothetical protein